MAAEGAQAARGCGVRVQHRFGGIILRDGTAVAVHGPGEREGVRRLPARGDRSRRPQLARASRQPDLHAGRGAAAGCEPPVPVERDRRARLFFERSALVETGQVAADMRASRRRTPDAAAAARLSAQPFYNARLRTTCVATRVEAGHANNALPQTARAVVNCRILPGEPRAQVEATLRRLAGDRVKVTVLAAPVTSPPSPLPAPMLARIERLVAAAVARRARDAGDGGRAPPTGCSPAAPASRPTRRRPWSKTPTTCARTGRTSVSAVEAFERATEFWYRLVKAFGTEGA